MAKLTDKQKIFCNEYLIDLNATQAAIRAGYSKKTASRIAIELLNKTHVSDEIRRCMKEREQRTEITQDKVLKELAKIGFANLKDYLEYKTAKSVISYEDGEPIIDYRQVIDVVDSKEVDMSIIQEVSVSKDGTFKFKLHDKQKALELIGKHLGMFTDKIELNGKLNSDVVITIGGEEFDD